MPGSLARPLMLPLVLVGSWASHPAGGRESTKHEDLSLLSTSREAYVFSDWNNIQYVWLSTSSFMSFGTKDGLNRALVYDVRAHRILNSAELNAQLTARGFGHEAWIGWLTCSKDRRSILFAMRPGPGSSGKVVHFHLDGRSWSEYPALGDGSLSESIITPDALSFVHVFAIRDRLRFAFRSLLGGQESFKDILVPGGISERDGVWMLGFDSSNRAVVACESRFDSISVYRCVLQGSDQKAILQSVRFPRGRHIEEGVLSPDSTRIVWRLRQPTDDGGYVDEIRMSWLERPGTVSLGICRSKDTHGSGSGIGLLRWAPNGRWISFVVGRTLFRREL